MINKDFPAESTLKILIHKSVEKYDSNYHYFKNFISKNQKLKDGDFKKNPEIKSYVKSLKNIEK